MITQEKRIQIINFLYSFNEYFVNNANYSALRNYSEEQLYRIKEAIITVTDVLSLFSNGGIDNITNSTVYSYEWLIEEDFLSNLRRYASIGQEDFLSNLKGSLQCLISDELAYEQVNGINSNNNAFVNVVDAGIYFYSNFIAHISSNNYLLKNIEVSKLKHILFTNYGIYVIKVAYQKGNRIVKRKMKVLYEDSAIKIKILELTPNPHDDNERKWLISEVLLNYTVLDLSYFHLISDYANYFITEINERIRVESDSIVNNITDEESSHFNPDDHIGSYTHQRVSIPIIGNLMGVELEYDGDQDEIFKFKRSFERLNDTGWTLESDSSVTFEMKSSIMELTEIQNVFNQNKMLFKTWANLTNPEKAGLHFHIAMDDSFSVDKRPASRTRLFMIRLAQLLERTVLKDSDARKAIFKRDYQHDYCREYGNIEEIDRYRWINFRTLDRDAGKTIEIRLFSSSAANELDEAAEKALLIAKLFKSALKDWRAKERTDFMTWQQSFGNTNIFEALFDTKESERWAELFIL